MSDLTTTLVQYLQNNLTALFEEIRKVEAKRDAALARVEEFNMQCKRLLDSSLGLEYSHEGQKIKSARLSLKRLMSLPTIGAVERIKAKEREVANEAWIKELEDKGVIVPEDAITEDRLDIIENDLKDLLHAAKNFLGALDFGMQGLNMRKNLETIIERIEDN
jgi:hypothetical protein